MKLETLVTTMHQKGFEKFIEMNIQTDVIFANQTDTNAYEETKIGDNTVKLISTKTRGLSRNRNIAITNSSADIVLFTDDDVRFRDGYEDVILNEFKKHPEASAIRFSMFAVAYKDNAITDSEKAKPLKNPVFRKATRKEISRYGVCGLAIKTTVMKEKSMFFNESFGSGTEDFCGEDTIFLQELLNKKVALYLSEEIIADIDKSGSTWFEGYTAKYFTVIGKVLANIYPRLCRLIVIRSAYKFSKRPKCHLKFWEILSSYYKGINEQKKK